MRRRLTTLACAIAVVLAGATGATRAQTSAATDDTLVYVGTYTRAGSEGIYAFRFDEERGTLSPIGLAARTSNPSFLAVHPNGRWVYAVNEDEVYQGADSGSVSAFAIDRASGRLTPLNQRSSRGGAPCHISIDRTGRYALVANYGAGSVAALPIGSDGRLGEATSVVQHTGSGTNPDRQGGPHAHAIVVDDGNRFVLAADLGIDKVLVYRFDAERGTLSANDPPGAALTPGSGPRHIVFAPSGRWLYAINELTSTITAFGWDRDRGVLTSGPTVSTVPSAFTGANTTAELAAHPSGRFVYGSNRGHDSIAVFSADPGTGALSAVGHVPTGGRTPRNFALDPQGRWLVAANQDSSSLVVYRVDEKTGALDRIGDPAVVTLPVCVLFVPATRR
jgi:6-phosphogluconolactonase